MIPVFRKTHFNKRKSIPVVKFDYIRDRVRSNLKKALQHYEFIRKPVKNDHPLVVLINSLRVSHSIEILRYLNMVEELSSSVGRGLKMASEFYPGEILPKSRYYGDNVSEFTFLFDSGFKGAKNWKSIRAVDVVAHPRTDMSLNALTANNNKDTSGHCIIRIDIKRLMYQYRAWHATQLNVPDGEKLTTAHFVGMYVLPRMLLSHVDVAWINNIRHELLDLPRDVVKPIRGLALPNHQTHVDETIRTITNGIIRADYTFEDMMLDIRLFTRKDLVEWTRLPPMAPTRSTRAIEAMVCHDWLEVFLAMLLHSDKELDTSLKSDLRIAIRRLMSDKTLSFNRGDSSHWITSYEDLLSLI